MQHRFSPSLILVALALVAGVALAQTQPSASPSFAQAGSFLLSPGYWLGSESAGQMGVTWTTGWQGLSVVPPGFTSTTMAVTLTSGHLWHVQQLCTFRDITNPSDGAGSFRQVMGFVDVGGTVTNAYSQAFDSNTETVNGYSGFSISGQTVTLLVATTGSDQLAWQCIFMNQLN